MSYFNKIAQSNPENISEKNQKEFSSQLFRINNKRLQHFDSADYFGELDLTRKEREFEIMNNRLINPPLIGKKFPVLRQELIQRRKRFDSADYFLEEYEKARMK